MNQTQTNKRKFFGLRKFKKEKTKNHNSHRRNSDGKKRAVLASTAQSRAQNETVRGVTIAAHLL